MLVHRPSKDTDGRRKSRDKFPISNAHYNLAATRKQKNQKRALDACKGKVNCRVD